MGADDGGVTGWIFDNKDKHDEIVQAYCTAVWRGCLLSPAAWAENWQVAKDEEGIKISLSEVAGSKYKAYQGVTVIKAPLAKVQALQEDAVGACAWIHECKSQKLLKHEGDQSWTYTQFNTPWPVTPRDSILRVTTVKGADGSLVRNLKEEPTYLPEEKGFVRVAKVEASGSWCPRATARK